VSLSALDPARTALLVIDMQNAFVHEDGTLGSLSALNSQPDPRTAPV